MCSSDLRSHVCGQTSNYSQVRSFTTGSTTASYTITTSSNPSSGGTTSGGGTFPSGSNRTVTATANSGYTFSNWTENGSVVSSSSTFSFTLNSNRNLVANFSPEIILCQTCPTYNVSITPATSFQTHSSSIPINGCKIYRFSVTSGQTYTFKTGCGDGATATFDTQLYLYDNNCVEKTSNDDGCESSRDKIEWTANYTGLVYLKIEGYDNSSGNYTLAYSINCTLPAQPGAISGTSPVCQGTSGNYYSVNNIAGVTYTWNVPGGTILSGQGTNLINVNWDSSGTNLITVTPSNSCGSGPSRNYSVNVLPLPSAVSVSGGGTYCNSATLTATANTGTIYWQGTTSNGTSTATPSTSQTITSSGTYYFRAYNACGWGTQGSATVTINPSPTQPSTISGTSPVCQGSTQTYRSEERRVG